MEDWSRPNPLDSRFHGSGSSHSLHTATQNRRGEHHQERLDAQFPLGSPASSLSSPPAPSPAFLPNQPALWQLGRHSWYIPGDDKPPHFSDAYEERTPPSAAKFFPRAPSDQKDGRRVPSEFPDTNEAQLRDVEEELHRGLKARQVRRSRNR